VGLVTLSAIQQHAADVSGDGEIDSADVTLILRLAVGLPINPPEASSKTAIKPENQVVRAASSLRVWLPDLHGDTGTDVTVPVYASDLAGVAGSKLQINFNPAVLQFRAWRPGRR